MALFNIICVERNMYWAENSRGYTQLREYAGIYTEAEVKNICTQPFVNDKPIPTDSHWILVGGYEEIPLDLAIVSYIEDGAKRYGLFERHGKLLTIGNQFAFDAGRVLAYKPFGELL